MTDDFQWGVSIPEPDINETGEFFAALTDHLHATLVSQGIDAAQATAAIDATLVHLANTFAGEKLYVWASSPPPLRNGCAPTTTCAPCTTATLIANTAGRPATL